MTKQEKERLQVTERGNPPTVRAATDFRSDVLELLQSLLVLKERLRLEGYILKRLAEIDKLKHSPAYKDSWSQGNLAGQDYALRAMASQI